MVQVFGQECGNDTIRKPLYYKIILAVLLLIIFVCILGFISFGKPDSSSTNTNNAICTSDECIRAAKSFKYSMDTSVDPCDDFYKYACGRWSEDNPNHGWTKAFSNYYALKERIVLSSLDVLMANDSNTNTTDALTKSRDFYTSCVDEDRAKDRLGLTPIYKYLKRAQLPLVPRVFHSIGSASNSDFDWMQSETLLKKIFMMDVFIGFRIDRNIKNSSRNDIIIGKIIQNYTLTSILKRKQGIPVRFIFKEPKISREKKSNIIKFIISKVIFNVTENSPTDFELQNAADVILNMTDDINKIVNTNFNLTKNNVLLYTVKTLQSVTNLRLSSFQSDLWYKYFDYLFGGTNINIDTDKDPLYTTTAHVQYIFKILRYVLSTPDEHLQLYLWWQVVRVMAPSTSTDMVNYINKQMDMPIQGSVTVPRPVSCAILVDEFMGYAVSYTLADKLFSNTTKRKVKQMIEEIKQAYIENLNNNQWMDSLTKEVTIEKDREMLSIIGYPGWLFEKGKLDDYYKDVVIHRDTFLDNIINVITSRNVKIMNLLRKVHERGWDIDPIVVNSYHKYQENAINIPMAILNFPFYNLGLEVLNYGSIGSILGHELSHGFDNKGRLYDMHGNIAQWWSDDTIAAYKGLTQCFIDQYGNFKIDSIKTYINGTRTLDENIADNGGLNQAFTAYKNYVKQFGEEPKLVGFENFTSYQMFFIAHGYSRCESTPPTELQLLVKYDTHCPHSIRLLGTLQNSQDFAAAFNCPVGSNMNPQNKCKIW